MLLGKQGIDSPSTMTLKAASPFGIICRERFQALPKPLCVCASLSQLTNAGKKDEKTQMETAGMHFLIGCQCVSCDCKLLKIEQTMKTIDRSKLGLLRDDVGPPPPPLWSHWLKRSCSSSQRYLAEEGDVEAERLRVPGAGIHVIPHQEHQLQQSAEALTLLHFLTGKCHVHDVRSDVVHLLLERQLEQDAIQPRPEQFHWAHLGGNEGRNSEKKTIRPAIFNVDFEGHTNPGLNPGESCQLSCPSMKALKLLQM